MTELSRILPSHPDEGATFIIEDKIGVYAAAMVYRDRHPVSGHLRLANPQNPEHVDMLEWWIGRRETPVPTSLNNVGVKREESGQERDRRICWEVYCELVDAIKDGRTAPAHPARDPHGQMIPIACKIWTRDLLSLARRRGDAGKAIMALAEANALNETAWPKAEPAASESECDQRARSEMVASSAGVAPPLDDSCDEPPPIHFELPVVGPSNNLTNDVADENLPVQQQRRDEKQPYVAHIIRKKRWINNGNVKLPGGRLKEICQMIQGDPDWPSDKKCDLKTLERTIKAIEKGKR